MDIVSMAVAKALAKEYTDSQLQDLGIESMSYYFCSSGEYNTSTGVPNVTSPNNTTFYIAPAVGSGNGVFNVYIYKNNAWVLFKSLTLDMTNMPIDDSLTMNNYAADAASVGDELTALKADLSETLIEHKGFQVDITRTNIQKKVYCKYPAGTEFSFILSNIEADIDGKTSGAIRLIYDDNGVETIDSTYRMSFSVFTSSTDTLIKKTLTLPMDIIGIQFWVGNYNSSVTVRKCRYDVDFFVNEDANIQAVISPFVSYKGAQELTSAQKATAQNNIDAQPALTKSGTLTATGPSTTGFLQFAMAVGDKITVTNNGSASIQCTANSGTPGSVLQNFGSIAAGASASFYLTVDAPVFRVWFTKNIVSGDTVSIQLTNHIVAGIQGDVAGIQGDVAGIQGDVAGIQGGLFNRYDYVCPQTGVAEYWNIYLDGTWTSGETIRFVFTAYSGQYFRYVRLAGRIAGSDTTENIVNASVSIPIDNTATLTKSYDRLWIQIARTQAESGVTATFYLMDDASFSVGSDLINLQKEIDNIPAPRYYTCLKDGTGDFNSLATAIQTVCEEMDTTLYVGPGSWDLIDELGETYLNTISSSNRGLYLKNRVHVICSSDALITCHYDGDRSDTITWLSAFNAGPYGFTLENATIESSNCRYTIHDERDTSTDHYDNIYLNCRMKHDNTNGGYRQVIGGGLGYDGHIIIDGCVFENPNASGSSIVSYHNTWYAGGDGRSTVEVKGCYFKGTGTFRASWFGASQDITTFIVHDNSLGAAIQHVVENQSYMDDNPTWIQNTELFAWNNEIRDA